MQELLDFDVAIEPLDDGYRARVVASPTGEAYADFVLPFSGESLEILVLKVNGSIGRARRKVRRIQSEERRLLEDFGSQLFQAVFSGPVRDCLGRSRLVAENRDAGLRIRLRLPGVLANLPWEYLYDSEGGGFLGLSPEAALVRYVEMPSPVRPFTISPPLRILAMISAPGDMPGLEAEEEWDKLNSALGDLAHSGLVQVDRLPIGTLAALQRPLRLSEYHVLHFIGHGGYDEDAQDGALALEGSGGQIRLVTGRDLGLMIRGHRSLRLVVLNACEGARTARDDPFGGVAQALVRQGVPAVIAMQFEISDPAALVFSQAFYEAIADGLPVDVAMVEARRAMFAEGNEVEWATPVLYLRSPDGRIFVKDGAIEADRKAREEADRKAREEADRKAREEADRKARVEADRKARVEADRKAQRGLIVHPAEPVVRIKFGQTVYSVEWHPSKDEIVASGLLGWLKIYNSTTGAERLKFKAAPFLYSVYEVAFSPGGTRLATGSSNSLARIWDAAAGAKLLEVRHTGEVHAVAFSPDGTRLATGSRDKLARIWDAATGAKLLEMPHNGALSPVAFSPDGTRLATGSGLARIWDAATGAKLLDMPHNGGLSSMAFSPDGTYLATGSDDKQARIWDATTGAKLLEIPHGGTVWTVTFSPDGTRLATGSEDKLIQIWPVQ